MHVSSRTLHIWIARTLMPLWCLMVSASILGDYDRLWLPVVFCLLAGITASSLLLSLGTLILFWRLMRSTAFSEEGSKASPQPAPSQHTNSALFLWLSWLIEMSLLMLMMLVQHVQERTLLLLLLLSAMAVMFCVRGSLLRFPPLWSTGASILLILMLGQLGFPPSLWATSILGCAAVVLWAVSMSGMKELWDLVRAQRKQACEQQRTHEWASGRYPDEHE